VARRAGKAASRKARQRNVPRAAVRPAPVVPADAPEAVTRAEPARRETPPPSTASAASGSTLTVRERAEYHYVERDLRNIAILTALMALLLLAAWVVFTTTGLVG
jgi:hypothetical protein